MSDTQWSQFLVFEQLKTGEAIQHAGSVHAPDLEMALLNARDVYARRRCTGLWVMPAESVFSKTAEELQDSNWQQQVAQEQRTQKYSVFQKLQNKGACIHVGEVEAGGSVQALQQALQAFDNDKALVWWVCPEKDILRSQQQDNESMFEPAVDKIYRWSSSYHTLTLMQEIQKQSQVGDDSET